jgi:hypothetical protein
MWGLTNRCKVGRKAANGFPDRTGKNPQTARADIVRWPVDASDTLLTPRARAEAAADLAASCDLGGSGHQNDTGCRAPK